MKKNVFNNLRKLSKREKKRILKDVSHVVAFALFGLAVVFILEYTDFFPFIGRFSYGYPTNEYFEQKETERLSLLSQVEANKLELSREARLEIMVTSNQVNEIFKKYLSHREYSLYLWCNYISLYRRLTKEESWMSWYLHEKVMKEMTPVEKEIVEEALNALKKIKEELREIQAKKQENK